VVRQTAATRHGGSFVRIREIAPSLSEAERRVASHILRHAERIPDLSITELANRAGVSEATVVRLCKRIGLRGYQELRIRLSADLAGPRGQVTEQIAPGDGLDSMSEKLFQRAVQALQDTLHVLDRMALARAVERVAGARRVDLYGVAASGVVALDAEQKFLRVGLEAHAFTDPHLQATSAALLGTRDVAIGISHSGSTVDTVKALALARRNGAHAIAITQFGPSPITRVADTVLHTVAHEPLLREAAITSRLVALAVVDAVFLGVALRRFSKTMWSVERTREAVLDRKF
jgi:DNA-binding MurR/RpiR family transcriptional regulator